LVWFFFLVKGIFFGDETPRSCSTVIFTNQNSIILQFVAYAKMLDDIAVQ
jgi:hypothetical protein